MFLFSKRSRNIIKWIWGFFAVIISLTMVIAFSGFTSLATLNNQPQAQEIPPEVLAELEAQRNGTGSPEVRALLEEFGATGTVSVATPTIDRSGAAATGTPEEGSSEPIVTPSVPELRFDL